MNIFVIMKASEIISKKVYAIYEGNEVGYVLNFSLDDKVSNLEYLVIATLYEENEFILKVEDISSITDEAVFINSTNNLSFEANAEPNNPIGKKIFSVKGEFLGNVVDVEINKNQVKKIIGNMCEILPKHIYSSGKDCLFFSKIKGKKSKIIEKNYEIDVKIQKISLPLKQKVQGMNLIGKVLFKDVLDKNSIIIFRKNEKITPKILIEARNKGVLKKLEDAAI